MSGSLHHSSYFPFAMISPASLPAIVPKKRRDFSRHTKSGGIVHPSCVRV
nr:MAG TPA: hypothetical protein [Caudoviricetes sp.]